MLAGCSDYAIDMTLYAALVSAFTRLIVAQDEEPVTPFESDISAETAFERALSTTLGQIVQAGARLLAIGVIVWGMLKAGSSFFGRGGGMGGGAGVGQALKPLVGAMIVAGLLFNLAWPVALVTAIGRAAVAAVEALVDLIPGVAAEQV